MNCLWESLIAAVALGLLIAIWAVRTARLRKVELRGPLNDALGTQPNPAEDKRLDRLLDYTKFHIGIYLSVGAGLVALIGAAANEQKLEFLKGFIGNPCALAFALVFMVIAGIAGGVIASCCTQYRTFEALWYEPQGPHRTKWFTGETWALIEHGSFWISAGFFAFAVLWSPVVKIWLFGAQKATAPASAGATKEVKNPVDLTDASRQAMIAATDGCKGREVKGEDAFGGPYALGGKGGPILTDAISKVAEFEAFSRARWSLSKVDCLHKDLFKNSIQWNMSSGFPFADRYQRYNYVVAVKQDNAGRHVATIQVASWQSPDQQQGDGHALSLKPPCIGFGVSSNSRYARVTARVGAMVNFFPEEPEVPQFPGGFPGTRSSPCSLSFKSTSMASRMGLGVRLDDIEKPRGVLDAHSKHFMLRNQLGNSLNNFQTLTAGQIDIGHVESHRWVKDAGVAYAGEIIVDVKNCRYMINQGSGTYRPAPGDDLANLKEVAKVFATVLETPPYQLVFVKPGAAPEILSVTGNTTLECPDAVTPTMRAVRPRLESLLRARILNTA